LLYTVGTFGLLAPVTFNKSSGSANLTWNSSTGGISATAGLTAGVTQSVVGTATGSDGALLPVTVNLTGAVPAPTNSVAPSVSGSATVGSTLTVATGTWTGSPTFTYQWNADGAAIPAATASTDASVSGDIGKAISCDVTGTNTGGFLTVSSSNSITVTAGGGAPSNSITLAGDPLTLAGDYLTLGA